MSAFAAISVISSALFMETSEKGTCIPGERKTADVKVRPPTHTHSYGVNAIETLVEPNVELNYMQGRSAMYSRQGFPQFFF
jgi:hypothetical protein